MVLVSVNEEALRALLAVVCPHRSLCSLTGLMGWHVCSRGQHVALCFVLVLWTLERGGRGSVKAAEWVSL